MVMPVLKNDARHYRFFVKAATTTSRASISINRSNKLSVIDDCPRDYVTVIKGDSTTKLTFCGMYANVLSLAKCSTHVLISVLYNP